MPAAAFEPDAQTVGLFHMDEGGGDRLGDSSRRPDGEVRHGGPSGGPTWDIGALAATAPTTTEAPPDRPARRRRPRMARCRARPPPTTAPTSGPRGRRQPAGWPERGGDDDAPPADDLTQ